MVTGRQDHAATLPMGNFGKRIAVLFAGLGDVDHDDVEIVFVELVLHFSASFDARKQKPLLVEDFAQQFANISVVLDDQNLAHTRHLRSPLSVGYGPPAFAAYAGASAASRRAASCWRIHIAA